jgi:hypothetical protein
VKVAGWREKEEELVEEEEMGIRKRLTSSGVRTDSKQLLSRARKPSDFDTTQRLEVDVHFCECFKICKGVGRAS